MNLKGVHCLVTGGAGFVGSHLVDKLVQYGAEVVAIDNLSIGRLENLTKASSKENFKFHQMDILDSETMKSIVKSMDAVFHLATRSVRKSLTQPSLVHEINVQGTYNLLMASAKAGVGKFVYCSSSEVNGTAGKVPMSEDYDFAPETIYGASKLAGEFYTQVFQRSGWLKTVIARPHNNYGPRAHYEGSAGELIPRFILRALMGAPLPVYGEGTQTRDFTFVEETAEFLIRLMADEKCTGETVNVCRGQEVSVCEIAHIILSQTGSKSELQHLPARPNDVLRLYGDHSKLKRLIGSVPSVGIEEGMKKTIEWYKGAVRLDESTRKALSDAAWGEEPREEWLNEVSNRKSKF